MQKNMIPSGIIFCHVKALIPRIFFSSGAAPITTGRLSPGVEAAAAALMWAARRDVVVRGVCHTSTCSMNDKVRDV